MQLEVVLCKEQFSWDSLPLRERITIHRRWVRDGKPVKDDKEMQPLATLQVGSWVRPKGTTR